MNALVIDFLNQFSDKDINGADSTYFLEYVLEKTTKEESNHKCDNLIIFYQSIFAVNENMADKMLDTFVDSYIFCAYPYIDESLTEECAEKIFNIKYRDKLINLFGLAAIPMINAKNKNIQTKAFDIVKYIGTKEDIPEPLELFGNGVCETASAWHTGIFCRLCYAKALINGQFSEHDPIKGLNILNEEFVTNEFYKDTIGLDLQEYLIYMKDAYKQFINKKDYDKVYEILKMIPYWLYEDEENHDDFIDEHSNLILEFINLLNKENIDTSKYDWSYLDYFINL